MNYIHPLLFHYLLIYDNLPALYTISLTERLYVSKSPPYLACINKKNVGSTLFFKS